jgi:hypothetical protein
MRRVREILRSKFAANVPIREIAWLVGAALAPVRDGAGTLSSGGADLAAARACPVTVSSKARSRSLKQPRQQAGVSPPYRTRLGVGLRLAELPHAYRPIVMID